jgi:mannose/fructose-specific phosphotransferase system component IIA
MYALHVGHVLLSVLLLVNAAKYCAGLNLQFVTQIVYYRKMSSSQIEAQIAARGGLQGCGDHS